MTALRRTRGGAPSTPRAGTGTSTRGLPTSSGVPPPAPDGRAPGSRTPSLSRRTRAPWLRRGGRGGRALRPARPAGVADDAHRRGRRPDGRVQTRRADVVAAGMAGRSTVGTPRRGRRMTRFRPPGEIWGLAFSPGRRGPRAAGDSGTSRGGQGVGPTDGKLTGAHDRDRRRSARSPLLRTGRRCSTGSAADSGGSTPDPQACPRCGERFHVGRQPGRTTAASGSARHACSIRTRFPLRPAIGRPRAVLRGHTTEIYNMAFSPAAKPWRRRVGTAPPACGTWPPARNCSQSAGRSDVVWSVALPGGSTWRSGPERRALELTLWDARPPAAASS